MDESIRPVHPKDLIKWPNGNREFRDDVDPIWLENPADYEVVPYNSPGWIAEMEPTHAST
jgi:hypothetical protein